jgi:hypothetical protein
MLHGTESKYVVGKYGINLEITYEDEQGYKLVESTGIMPKETFIEAYNKYILGKE